jgi:hypothetical protein
VKHIKVYYSSSLWTKEKGSPGIPQRVNWKFEYNGTKCYIPTIYRFSEGVVFDILTIIDEKKLREFIDKYETTENIMTPLQRRCAEQEHPYQSIPINEIWINGTKVDAGYSSSSSLSIPWAEQGDELSLIRNAYSHILKDTSFACQRYCVPYPQAASKLQSLLRLLRLSKIKSIKLSTSSVHRFIPIELSFEASLKEGSKELCFKHPLTGEAHTLYFQSFELIEMPLQDNSSMYMLQALYEIEPALSKGQALQFNSSTQYMKAPVDRFSPASSIGIIGGAFGPTSIILSSKNTDNAINLGLHSLPLHHCLSVPEFRNKDSYTFILEGINAPYCEGKEYLFT